MNSLNSQIVAANKRDWKKRAADLYDASWLQQLPDSYVLPQFDGLSIANLPASIGQTLGVNEGWSNGLLDKSILECLPESTKRVVLMVVDGVAWSRLTRQLEEDDAGFASIFETYGLHATSLTSVAPSTTSVATTVLTGNGAMAAESGMMGYTYLLAELGLVANMLFWQPAWQANAVYASLESWGIKPESFLPTPSAAQVFKRSGINHRVIMPAIYAKSPLSRMQMREADIDGFMNQTDMWLKLQDWLSDTKGKQAQAYLYYSDFDSLSHRDGSDAAIWSALWETFCFEMKQFLKRLKDAEDTVLLITADHGHMVCSEEDRVYIEDHKELLDLCSVMPAGEARHMYFYARHGAKDDLKAYATETFKDKFVVLDAPTALKNGLYGPTEHLHPEALRRMGDVTLISKERNYLWSKTSKSNLKGKHGGLEPDEMLVPLIALGLS